MEDTRRLGIEYLNQRNYPAALKALMEAEKLYPDDSFLQNTLGYAYMAMEQYDLAVTHFKTAIQLRPDYSEAKNNLGVVYIYKKEWDRAIVLFEEITQDLLYSTPHIPRVNLGWVYYNKKDYARSEQYYLKALKFRPNFDDALHGLARTYLAGGRVREAVEKLEVAARISPGKSRLIYDLADAYARSDEVQKAVVEYRKVMKLVPGTPLAAEASRALKRMGTNQ